MKDLKTTVNSTSSSPSPSSTENKSVSKVKTQGLTPMTEEDHKKRESALVMRLSAKEQEIQELQV